MKKAFSKFYCSLFVTACFLLLSTVSTAQSSQESTASSKPKFGFRVGLNYAKVRGSADSIHYQYKPGFMIAVFLSPHTSGVIGFKHELLYSRQGFQYTDSKGHSGSVTNDYLMIPQMMTVNITRFVQLQAGIFAGYLLHSKDSNEPSDNSSSSVYDSYTSLMNRIDYGAAGGIEIHPIKGLTLNARYNMGFAKLYKKEQDNQSTANYPMMYPLPFQNIDTKNAVLQFSVGYQF